MKHGLKWLTLAALISVGLWAQSRAGGEAGGKKSARPPYVHTVIFYLKEDAPKNQVDDMIADAHRLLGKIPSVKGLWIGRPADKSTPKLAQTDYSVGMLILFDDYAGLKEYLDHKLHVEFRDKHAKFADRVPVYDFVDQRK